MNSCIWYNIVTTEAELNIEKNNKTETPQAETTLEWAVAQEWTNEKHTEIALPRGENPSYKPLFVDLAKKSQ